MVEITRTNQETVAGRRGRSRLNLRHNLRGNFWLHFISISLNDSFRPRE